MGRLFNRGYNLEAPIPRFPIENGKLSWSAPPRSSSLKWRHDDGLTLSCLLLPAILYSMTVSLPLQAANLLRLRGQLEAGPFEFLNLGLLAYLGSQQALAQVQTGNFKVGRCGYNLSKWGRREEMVASPCYHQHHRRHPLSSPSSSSSSVTIQVGETAGQAGNLLWRSVYLVKQVSTRNRVLVLFDW